MHMDLYAYGYLHMDADADMDSDTDTGMDGEGRRAGLPGGSAVSIYISIYTDR